MFLVVLLGTLAVPVVAGAIYQAIGTWRDRRRFPPPGRLLRFNERRTHIRVTGEGTPTVVFESDNPTITKSVLESQGLAITETDVVQVKLPHRPGEIARVASRLGEANVNINYAYCGLEPGTNFPLACFGVAEGIKAAPILDQAAAAAAKP